MIITITGNPGSGKSTVGKIIAKQLGYKFVSMGDIRGQLAVKHEMTINELNKLGETESWTDEEIDNIVKSYAEKDNVVLDSRTAWYFLKESVKVYIDVDPKIGAERVMQEDRHDEIIPETVDELVALNEERMKSDALRYKKYYDIDVLNMDNYDLVLDSSKIPAAEVAKKVIDYVNSNKE